MFEEWYPWFISHLLVITKFRAKIPSRLGVIKNFPHERNVRFQPTLHPQIKKKKKGIIHLVRTQNFPKTNISKPLTAHVSVSGHFVNLAFKGLTSYNICSVSSRDQKQTSTRKFKNNCSVSGLIALKIRTKVCDTMTSFTYKKPMTFTIFNLG